MQKREFLYIQVNDGQGVYTWIDYNEDGVKDLNEFEISQFIDQANYIRVFVPSNTYVTTYFNEFNQTVYLRPERVWSRKKGAGQKIMEEALSFAKSKGYKRIVTLSPLTPMATHYHIRNGAKLLGLNPTTQNFEYSL